MSGNDLYFSVVIPTYNRLPVLLKVLDSLSRQVDAPAFEVVLIDDGSTDATAEKVRELRDGGALPFRLTFESQQNSGPGKARNEGVTLASGRYVVFIGDDTVPEPRFLVEHAAIHRAAGDDLLVAVLGYTGWPTEERVTAFMDYINDYGLQFGYELIKDGTVVPFNFFYTSNISLDRELLLKHPFDTSFPAAAWEDIELAFRLDKLGLRIHYTRKAVTRHYHPITVDSFARRQYTVGKSGAIFFEKHPDLGHFLGVHELSTRQLANDEKMKRLRIIAKLGERLRVLARTAVFERLMREHYLRGLRDGLEERRAV